MGMTLQEKLDLIGQGEETTTVPVTTPSLKQKLDFIKDTKPESTPISVPTREGRGATGSWDEPKLTPSRLIKATGEEFKEAS